MTIDLYYTPGSPPCRAVLLTAEALGVKLNLIDVDVMKREQYTPEFLKINPQHTVPTLLDDGLVLIESRAMLTYLISKYGKDDSLYPKDPNKRALVDQRLYFDAASLYSRYEAYYFPLYFDGKPLEPYRLDKLKDAFDIFNTLLASSKFAAGDSFSVADISLVATVSTAEVSGFDIAKYPNVARWYETVKVTAPGYKEINEKNIEFFRQKVELVTKKK